MRVEPLEEIAGPSAVRNTGPGEVKETPRTPVNEEKCPTRALQFQPNTLVVRGCRPFNPHSLGIRGFVRSFNPNLGTAVSFFGFYRKCLVPEGATFSVCPALPIKSSSKGAVFVPRRHGTAPARSIFDLRRVPDPGPGP